MSHSVPPDSSLLGRLFPISSELVRFARPDAAIHAAPQLWAQAGNDAPLYGLPVDRLYSEEAELHVEMTPLSEELREIAAAMDDPLVALPGLSDGILLPACELQSGLPRDSISTGMETIYDFIGGHGHVLPQNSWPNDVGASDWFYDHHV
jgi:hypothetical protein